MAKKGHGGHHGGSWKVAYADFVTAMMALFLCLWLTSQDQKIKDAVERAFRNPFSSVTKESVGIIPNKEASSTYRQSGKFSSISAFEMEAMHHLSEDLAKLFKDQDSAQASVKIDVTSEGLCINVFDRSQKPIFNSGTEVFTDYGAWVFNTLAWEIARYTHFKIELEGHTTVGDEWRGTSSATPGTASPAARRPALGNWELSTERANAARRKILDGGVGDSQICKVSGFADTVPMPDTAPTDEANRRVTVMIKVKDSINNLPEALSSDIAK
jgi:chemotaxis protein MotB